MAECLMPPLQHHGTPPPLPDTTSTIHNGNNVKVGDCLNVVNVGYGRKENFDMDVLLDISKARWLNVSELCFLLDMKHTPLPITRHPPESAPPSGSLILYNRSFTRNYKEDHYSWVKKRNSTKVREDHVKLRLGGKYRVAGCYVHCINIATMHRRAYHLLHTNEDGSEPVLPAGNGMLKSPTSLVLVHYLDTQVASVFASTLDDERNMSLMNLLPEEYKVQARKPGSGRKSKKQAQSAKKPAAPLQQEAIVQEKSITSPKEEGGDGTTYDDEALDILWTMVMEEGSDNVMQVLDNDAVGAMLESHASFGALLEMDGNGNNDKQTTNHNRSISDDFLGMLNNDEKLNEQKEEEVCTIKKRSVTTTTTSTEEENWDHSEEYHQWKNAKSDHSYGQEIRRQVYPNYKPSSPPNSSPSQSSPPPPPPPYNNYQQNVSSQYEQYYDPNRWNNGYKQGQQQQQQQDYNKQQQQQGNNNNEAVQYNYNPQQHSSSYNYQMPYNAYVVQSYPSEGSEPLNIPQTRSNSPSPVVLPVQPKHRPLPDIVDFTPEHFTIGTPKTKVALSFSAPLPQKPDDSKNSTWHRLAVFAEVQMNEKLILGDIDLSPIHELNPYSYRCNVPTSASKPGNRKIFITEVKLYKGVDPICEGILQFITEALHKAWDNAVLNQKNNKKNIPIKFFFSKKDESSSIRLLTQLSVSNFELEAPIITPKVHYPVQQLRDPRIEQQLTRDPRIEQQLTHDPRIEQQLTHDPRIETKQHPQMKATPPSPIDTRKRTSGAYIDEEDRHSKVRFVKESEAEPQSPISQPKLIQLLHVAQMNQNGNAPPPPEELTFG